MFPIYELREGQQLPKTGTFFVLANDGIYLHKDLGISQTFTKVDRLYHLDPMPEDLMNIQVVPVDAELFFKVRKFFESVWSKHQSEAVVILYYSPSRKQYAPLVPFQLVTRGGVRYQRPKSLDAQSDFRRVGTIHSHSDFHAFHSSIDEEDESHDDGLHITVGHNDSELPSLTASLVVNGVRNAVSPLDAVIGLSVIGDRFAYWAPENKTVYDAELSTWMQLVHHIGHRDESPEN